MKQCTTHHHACDCRESEFEQLRAQLEVVTKERNQLGDELIQLGAQLKVAESERDEASAEVERLRGALRDALGHSSCYCQRCKHLSELYWIPEQSDSRQERK